VSVPLPPRWIRRLLLQPIFWLSSVCLLVVGLPFLLVVMALLSFAVPAKLRALRLLGFAIVYLTLEVVALVLALGSWLASGFGWGLRRPAFVEFHYRVVTDLLRVLHGLGSKFFVLSVERRGPDLPGDDGDPETIEHPLLVLSRHAGPGDSFLLVHELLTWEGRRPRVVLKETLQWDPMIDVLLNRLPMTFLDPTPGQQDAVVEEIGRLAASMSSRDALLIFPEGGNVTAARRTRAIERLRRSHRETAAVRAEGIVNLLPPRPRGVRAALIANQDLEVVVVAHTGLDELNTVRDIWRAIPVDKTMRLRWHAVRASEVPTDPAGLSDWLFTEWEQMDAWVSAHRPGAPEAIG